MNNVIIAFMGIVILSLVMAVGYMVFKIVKSYTDFLKGVGDE